MMKRLILTCVVAAMLGTTTSGQVMRLDGTSRDTFKVGATSAAPLSLLNNAGSLSLAGGLAVTGGSIDFATITVTDLGLVTTADINGGTLDGVAIGAATRAAGSFTSLAANNGLTVSGGSIDFAGASIGALGTIGSMDLNGGTIDGTTIGGATPAAGSFTSLSANNGLTVAGATTTLNNGAIIYSGLTVGSGTTSINSADINGGAIDNTAIGSSTPAGGAFTILSASGQFTSTVPSGTAPFVVASDTKVSNLNAEYVNGITFLVSGSPGALAYRSDTWTSSWSAVGTAGQVLLSGGSSAPTWAGLDQAKVWIGSSGDVPVARTISGDCALGDTGTIMLNNGTISPAKLTSSMQDLILYATASAGAEVSDTRACSLQIKDANGNNQAGVYRVHWNIADANYSPGETAQSVTVSYDEGGEWQQIVANKKAVAFTNSSGLLTLDVTHTSANTLYLMLEFKGKVYPLTLSFT